MTITFCGKQTGRAYVLYHDPPVVVITCTLDFGAHGIIADAVNTEITWWYSKFPGGGGAVEMLINGERAYYWMLSDYWVSVAYNYVAHDGDVITWKIGAGIGPGVDGIVDYAYVQTSGLSLDEDECNGYCIIFEWIGDRFFDIEEWWTDFGASAESWWIIGDEVKALCDLVMVPFREAKEFFYQLDEWCEKICHFACRALGWDAVLANITAVFAMLSYTTSQFVTWLYDSLQEAINFEGLWDWINHADEWFDSKLSGFKDGLEDWIAEKFERILDKVFKP